MNEIKNRNLKEAQKKYAAIIGTGLCAVALFLLFYGVGKMNQEEEVKQQIQLGENNPVSGPVASTEAEKAVKETMQKESTKKEENTRIAEDTRKNSKEQFSYYNGADKLNWPITGNVIIPYSMDTTVYFETLDQFQCSPAIHIKGEKGTQVRAVYEGVVSNVEKNNRYGNMVTIDMGNGYKAIYGQLEAIPLKEGDLVERGMVIGSLADPSDYFILEGSHLYFKMTLEDEPINPTEFLKS